LVQRASNKKEFEKTPQEKVKMNRITPDGKKKGNKGGNGKKGKLNLGPIVIVPGSVSKKRGKIDLEGVNAGKVPPRHPEKKRSQNLN